MVLAILVNMGQISNNRVARSIYYTELDTTGFEGVIRNSANAGGVNVASVYASDQSSPVLAGNGLKDNVSGLWCMKMRFLLTRAYVHVHSTDGDSMVSCSNGICMSTMFRSPLTSPSPPGFCGGDGTNQACSERSFGYRYQPFDVLQQDVSSQYRSFVSQAISGETFRNSDYLAKFSQAANYLAFVGTIVIGASFLGE